MSESITTEEMLRKMSTGGLRVTEQRKSLAQLFAEAEGYLTPKDVYESMRQKYPGVSFDTVYRNLRILSEMGVLEQFYFLEGGLKFKANCQHHHHHHLICTQCEKTFSMDFCPMGHLGEGPEGFQISGHRFEIYGTCKECRENPAPEEGEHGQHD